MEIVEDSSIESEHLVNKKAEHSKSDIHKHGNCCMCNCFTYRKVNGEWLCGNCRVLEGSDVES